MAARFYVGRSWFKAGPHGGQVSGSEELLIPDLMAARFQVGRSWCTNREELV